MKALSVLPPWWWFILHGYKDIENRDWRTSFRGTVYLHVGKTFHYEEIVDDIWMISHRMPDARVPESFTTGVAPFVMDLKLSAGCLVGKVDIVGCVTESSSPWFFGKYGFQLANPVALPRPIPFRGMPGLFDVPEDIESVVQVRG